ncbi:MAG: 2-hydroxyacyl-CoA dehydratase [Candidatus Alcyoniella australis]|nr:2-hydroxyacyl-CoA dehydratase [Candidatus Alcyoniella australis]
MSEDRRIGLTATIPVEVVLAAGLKPVDLNNLFVAHPHSARLLQLAEVQGLPRQVCAWIRGIYAAADDAGIQRLAAVVRGDCTNAEALAELWRHRGKDVVRFAYPLQPDRAQVAEAIQELCRELQTDLPSAERWRERLMPIRRDLATLDELCWREGRVSGGECFNWQVASSDFRSDPESFGRELASFIEQAAARKPRAPRIRLGISGVPPAITDLCDVLETLGADVLFHESPRQFSMPYQVQNLAEQYARYTYPYPLPLRLRDVLEQVQLRGLHGVVHYVQAFCFHGIEHAVLRERSPVPVLLLEGDEPGPTDERTRTRLQAFIERISQERQL